MKLKCGIDIEKKAVISNLTRLMNQVYKLLPIREEKEDWIKPLNNIIEEIAGLHEQLLDHQELEFKLLCKLQGLITLTEDKDFMEYRSVIFACCGLISQIIENCQ